MRPQIVLTALGIVTAVDGDLTSVRSFTVLDRGELLTFVPAPDGEHAFPLPHLTEHLRDGDPVRVEWGLIDGVRVALRVEDG
jgi:hypothetical protein